MSNNGSSKLKQFGNSANTKKETGKKSTVRGNVFEVCQDLKNFDTEPDFSKCAESTGADEYMWLVHDHDTYSEEDLKNLESKGLDMTKYHLGDPKNDHVHVFMHFKNPTTLPKIAKAFGVPEQYVNHWSGRYAWNNAVSYLTHRTDEARGKYQYDPSDVHANFDYTEKLDSITQKVETLNANLSEEKAEKEFQRLVNLYTVGAISFSELERRLVTDPLVMQLAAMRSQYLDSLHAKRDKAEMDLFFKTFDQPQRVIWLYGDGGSGKSLAAKYMAKHFAKKRYPNEPPVDNSYQVLGSSTGTFERYSSSVHCIVLDDLRPSKSFQRDDLLRIFEPNKDQPASMPARYHDRLLAAGMIIVTSNIDPAEFYYRSRKKWTAVQSDLRLLYEGNDHYSPDSDDDKYQFDDIRAMMLSKDNRHEILRRFEPYGTECGSKEVVNRMRAYYDDGLRGVDCIEVDDYDRAEAQQYTEEDLNNMDAIKRAQISPDVIAQAHQVKGKAVWTRDWIRRQSERFAWNSIESPVPMMRRITAYHVSRSLDGTVVFKLMHPVHHDNGYCDYEADADPRLLSLEEIWESKCFSDLDLSVYNSNCDDFNDNFHVPSPYNSYCDDFNLDYEDQTLSDESDFMFRGRRTYLRIYGEDRSRYLDRGADPVVKADVEYDQQALDAVLKKVREQVDMM